MNTKLIRNSIPKQSLRSNQRLSIKAWNDYINILKDQANANTKFLEELDKAVIKVGALGDGSIEAVLRNPDVIQIIGDIANDYIVDLEQLPIPDAFLFTTEEPGEYYNNEGYGKILDIFEE